MKNLTIKVSRVRLINKLIFSFLLGLFFTLSGCKKDKELTTETSYDKALQQTVFENQEGTMTYLINDDQWAVKFFMSPPPGEWWICPLAYIAIIDPEYLNDSFKTEGKEIVFSGEIKECVKYPDLTDFPVFGGLLFRNLALQSIQNKQ